MPGSVVQGLGPSKSSPKGLKTSIIGRRALDLGFRVLGLGIKGPKT